MHDRFQYRSQRLRLSAEPHADHGVFKCDLEVLISDTKDVNNLCQHIKKLKSVNSATRVD